MNTLALRLGNALWARVRISPFGDELGSLVPRPKYLLYTLTTLASIIGTGFPYAKHMTAEAV